MIFARALRLFLAAALLAAWQGALLHPLEHFDQHGALVHLGGSEEKQDAQCDALAAVASCVGSSPLWLVFASPRGESHASSSKASLRGAPAPAYRSQAPPQLS